MHSGSVALALALIAPAAPRQAAAEPDPRAVARSVLASHSDAIVTVRLLLKQRIIADGRERNTSESTLEIAGTVLTAEGLTVVSDAASNPGAMNDARPGATTRLESETGDVELVLADGRQLPARFVLRDSDLDLAFLVPEEPLADLPHISLVETPLARPLDDLVFLFPMAKSLGREIGVALSPVRAVVRKPRDFLVADTFVGMQSLGCPAFDTQGRAIGLAVMRRSPIRPRPSGGFRDMFEFLNPVVLTARDVIDVAEQALAHAQGQAE